MEPTEQEQVKAPEAEGMVHRESSWEDPLSLGRESGPGEARSLFHCGQQDRRRPMQIRPGLGKSSSDHFQPCLEPPLPSEATPLPTSLHLLSGSLFLLPFVLSLNAEVSPDFLGPEAYSARDGLVKKKKKMLHHISLARFTKTYENANTFLWLPLGP